MDLKANSARRGQQDASPKGVLDWLVAALRTPDTWFTERYGGKGKSECLERCGAHFNKFWFKLTGTLR
jgi:hypothetical protein